MFYSLSIDINLQIYDFDSNFKGRINTCARTFTNINENFLSCFIRLILIHKNVAILRRCSVLYRITAAFSTIHSQIQQIIQTIGFHNSCKSIFRAKNYKLVIFYVTLREFSFINITQK